VRDEERIFVSSVFVFEGGLCVGRGDVGGGMMSTDGRDDQARGGAGENVKQSRTPRVDALEKLLIVFSEEQLMRLAELAVTTHGYAVERRCDQRLEIVFDEKGYPRYLNGSNNVRLEKPVTYKAE
jgi:hypothetical protein